MKIIYLIIASNDPIHETDGLAQKKTWLGRIPGDEWKFLRGAEGNIRPRRVEDLYVDCAEEYGLILKKTVLGLRSILSQKFDFVVRTNVSTYFNDLKLREELMKFHAIQEPLALGFWEIHKRPGGLEERFLSGTGIIMNYSCAKIISETEFDSYKMVPDDIAISREIKKKNVKVIPIRRCNLHKSKVFSNSCFIRLKSSERADLASSRMKLVNEYFIANKRSQRLRIRIKITCMEFRYINWNFSEIRRYAVDIYVLIRLYLINSRLRLGK